MLPDRGFAEPTISERGWFMRKLYSLAVVLLVALGAKAATVIAATCCGCPPCPLCK